MQVLPRFRGTFILKGSELSENQLAPLSTFLKDNPQVDFAATTYNTFLIYGRGQKQDEFVSKALTMQKVPFQLSAQRITIKPDFSTKEVIKAACSKLLAGSPSVLNLVEKLALLATTGTYPNLELPTDRLLGIRLKEQAEDAYAAQDYQKSLELFQRADSLLDGEPVDILQGTPTTMPEEMRPVGEVKAYLGFLHCGYLKSPAEHQRGIQLLHEADLILSRTLPTPLSAGEEKPEEDPLLPRAERHAYFDDMTDDEQEALRLHADTKQAIGHMSHRYQKFNYAIAFYEDALLLYHAIYGEDSPFIQRQAPRLQAYIEKYKPQED